MLMEHIGVVVRMSVSDYRGGLLKSRHQYVVSLSKTLYRIASVDSAVK